MYDRCYFLATYYKGFDFGRCNFTAEVLGAMCLYTGCDGGHEGNKVYCSVLVARDLEGQPSQAKPSQAKPK